MTRRFALLRKFAAVIVTLNTAVALPSVAGDQRLIAVPEPAPVWRRIFARPKTIPTPPDNPMTPHKVALGARLFHDNRLSGAANRSCSTCHNPRSGYSDTRPQPVGINGRALLRNAPALWNLAWAKQLYWDGRQPTLERQARVPIEHPNEMAGALPQIAERLNRDPDMRGLFKRAFPEPGSATSTTILKAIATFERSLISPITRFDEWIAGNAAALRPGEYRGFQLFTGRAGCLACHGGWRFTDDKFHDIGLPSDDPGRSAIDGGPAEARRFKTPGLRELVHSAPYMHDGSKATLRDVIIHYAGGARQRSTLAPTLVRNLKLEAGEIDDLVAFLKTLSR